VAMMVVATVATGLGFVVRSLCMLAHVCLLDRWTPHRVGGWMTLYERGVARMCGEGKVLWSGCHSVASMSAPHCCGKRCA